MPFTLSSPIRFLWERWIQRGVLSGPTDLLLEHAATIEKAMLQIEELGAADKPGGTGADADITLEDIKNGK